jgi:subtilisin family serine protease
MTMRRYWLIGWLLMSLVGMPLSRSVSAPSPAVSIKIVIELADEPAVVMYAAAQPLHLSATTAAQISRSQIARIEAAQQNLLVALRPFDATILYRTQRVYNGLAAIVKVRDLAAIRQLPGVKAVHPLISKSLDNWHSVPLIGAPQVWEAAGLTGAGVTIGIIDSGIDYLHADFGGPASAAAYTANDTTVITDTFNGPALFPTAKVVGGWDFVGDDYVGGGGSPASFTAASIPYPDPDPAPCYTSNSTTANHGTHVAGTAAGFGVNTSGSTYTGTYHANLNFSDFKVGPGVAPQARLYSLRVFGCNGDSDVVDQAIEWAVDPNGDGDFFDHLDVINLSLGSPYGAEEDSTAVAANNAVLAGEIVVAAAGNNGDEYYLVNTPGSATRAISVAGSDDGAVTLDGFRVISPTASAGVYAGFQSTLYDWLTSTLPITGQLVYPAAGDLADQDQRSGCYTFDITNTQIMSGNIALLNWTEPSCGSSVTRVGKAAAAGARGVLLVDNLDAFHLVIGGSSLIPAYGVPKDVGETLKVTLALTNVYVVLTAEYQGTIKRLEPFAENSIYASSARGPRRGDSWLKPDLTAPGVTIYSALNHSGTNGFALSGTSMATPHVAGTMALLRQLHPDWSVADLKALAMNTATTDIILGAQKYDPGRVGAGRVTLTNAASPAIAYAAQAPAAVSVSFGAIEVTDTLTLTQQIRVDNKSVGSVAYSIAYAAYAEVPGVTYTIAPTSVLVLPFSAANISVTLQAKVGQMKHTRTPTVSGSNGRAWLSEASGQVILTPGFRHSVFLPVVLKEPSGASWSGTVSLPSVPTLRVPVYAALRPASGMQAEPALLDFTSIRTTTLLLVGQGLNTGTQYPTDTLSLVSAFELAEVSAITPTQHPAADLRYLGVGNNFGATRSVTTTTLFFAIATQGDWSVPLAPEAQFKVFIDADHDGTDDFVLTNDTLNGQANDIFYSRLINLSNNVSTFALPINYLPADAYDTILFNTNVMILAVSASSIGLTEANPRFNYRVETFAASLPVDASAVHTFGADQPGLDFGGGVSGAPVWTDLSDTALPIRFTPAAYVANGSLGALVLHHHNAGGQRAQVLGLTP